MVEIVKFKAEHAKEICEQESTRHLQGVFRDANMLALEKLKYSYTLKVDGQIILVGGAVEHWPGRAEIWALLAGNIKDKFITVHREVLKFIKALPFNRIEATVDVNFKQAHRWIKLLGFKCEAPLLKSFYPNASDGALYAWVRG